MLWLLLLAQTAWVTDGFGDPSISGTPLATKQKITTCRKLLWAAASLVAISVAPTLFHNTAGFVRGQKHIGHGIYLDYETALQKFSDQERAILQDRSSDPIAKVRVVCEKLRGDYGSWYFSPWAPQSNASEFLDPAQTDRGVCRHKACVLKAMLDELNIKAELQCGNPEGCPLRWHVWVYLPDFNIIADPTEGTLTATDAYLERYRMSLNGVPMPGGWY